MAIDSLYKEYIQKSKVFMYPLLDVRKGVSVTPIETYCMWENHYAKEDCKLITLYHLRDDPEFKQFEKLKLLGNPLFHDFQMTEEDIGVYVFDYRKHKDDWMRFIEGKYSKFSLELKRKLQTHFGQANRGYIDSFLYPERYFKLYAELLTVDPSDAPGMLSTLREVGELCSKLDLEKENLTHKVKDLFFQEKNS
jgi:hypothetical protein